MQWFRFYSETLNDPKVQNLPPAIFKTWVNCLCLASSVDSRTGNIGTLKDVAFAFRETESTVSSAFHALIYAGLIETDNETFHIPKWSKRQYKSDCSTERVKRFRKRFETVSETAPESDTEQNRTEHISRNVSYQKNVNVNGYHASEKLEAWELVAAASESGKWSARMYSFNTTGKWLPDQWGPAPGQPDCRVPAKLLNGSV